MFDELILLLYNNKRESCVINDGIFFFVFLVCKQKV